MTSLYLIEKESPFKTPQPHHIPGYKGYVPQQKFKNGSTYSKITHRILSQRDPSKLILTHCNRVKFPKQPKVGDVVVVSGYTGHMPLTEPIYGLPYINTIAGAMESRGYDDDVRNAKKAIFLEHRRQDVPLTPKKAEADPYIPKNAITNINTKRAEGHITGYGGHVPLLSHIHGISYPENTKKSLSQFYAMMKNEAGRRVVPPDPLRKMEFPPEKINVYTSGMIPRYKGHVPGERFRFGRTFGCTTRQLPNYVQAMKLKPKCIRT